MVILEKMMTMKKIQVSTATNKQLDWLVAKCLSSTPPAHDTIGSWWFTIDGKDRTTNPHWSQAFNPTTRGDHMVPIIEREGISTVHYRNCPYPDMRWTARLGTVVDPEHQQHGCTSLIAAARCYVVSKLGDEVEVPEELT